MRLHAIALVALVTVAGCFSPDNPECTFSCNSSNNFDCPDDYTCNRGNTAACTGTTTCYCIRNDYTGVCPFPQADLSGEDFADASVEGDQSVPADLVSVDAPRIDAATPDQKSSDMISSDLRSIDMTKTPDLFLPDLPNDI